MEARILLNVFVCVSGVVSRSNKGNFIFSHGEKCVPGL